MKKIIAAALSVLVGAFGFTVVDTALENRVATLESQVAELQEYHQQISPETYTTTTKTTTTKPITATTHNNSTLPSSQSTTAQSQIQIGDYLTEYSNAQHKFLLRKYSNGTVSYIPPNYFNTTSHASMYPTATVAVNGVTSVHTYDTTDPRQTKTTTTKATTEKTHIYDPSNPAYEDQVVENTTSTTKATTALSYEEYFLYLTDSSAQVTNIEEDISYSYWYDNDYSQCSSATNYKKATITVKCKGYTDPAFTNKKIEFYHSAAASSINYISNIINSDGTFEYHAEYVIYTQSNIDPFYAINSPTIK